MTKRTNSLEFGSVKRNSQATGTGTRGTISEAQFSAKDERAEEGEVRERSEDLT